ncbi:helix-turn-helix transcriptional regulator, partial [Streptomyces chiangmaiensis]|nr:helix-turn-helix transcriptional regulator [Streptomyces chiangmaiensis]
MLNLLLAVSQYAGDRALWERTEQVLDSLSSRMHPLTALYRDAGSDVLRRGPGVRKRVEEAISLVADGEPWDITRLAVSAHYVDALRVFRPHLERMIDREQSSGATSDVMTMLHLVMLDQVAAGAWEEAEQTGLRGLEMTKAHGLQLFTHQFCVDLGLLAAHKGEAERARELQARVEAWSRPRGVGLLIQQADAVGTAAALSHGDYETAYRFASRITPPGTFE